MDLVREICDTLVRAVLNTAVVGVCRGAGVKVGGVSVHKYWRQPSWEVGRMVGTGVGNLVGEWGCGCVGCGVVEGGEGGWARGLGLGGRLAVQLAAEQAARYSLEKGKTVGDTH